VPILNIYTQFTCFKSSAILKVFMVTVPINDEQIMWGHWKQGGSVLCRFWWSCKLYTI